MSIRGQGQRRHRLSVLSERYLEGPRGHTVSVYVANLIPRAAAPAGCHQWPRCPGSVCGSQLPHVLPSTWRCHSSKPRPLSRTCGFNSRLPAEPRHGASFGVSVRRNIPTPAFAMGLFRFFLDTPPSVTSLLFRDVVTRERSFLFPFWEFDIVSGLELRKVLQMFDGKWK